MVNESLEERILRLEHVVKEQAVLLMTVADLIDSLTQYIQHQTSVENRAAWNTYRGSSTDLRDSARQHLDEVRE